MADLHRWTDRDGAVWECDAYDHGPFCRRCRYVGNALDDFFAWLQVGITHGWVSDATCVTHLGTPTTEEEDGEIDEGWDPCIHVLRIWESAISM